jgi:hypothetical protein
MSSTVSQLFIGYAHASCTTTQVKDAFENALNEDGIVARVDFREKQNDRGETFFCYFIHFAHENRQLQHMQAEIAKNGFVVLTYDRVWDRRQAKYVDRYWKVLPYIQKEKPTEAKFVPRLMSPEEASAAGIAAPKKKEISSGAGTLTPKEFPSGVALTNMQMAEAVLAKSNKTKPSQASVSALATESGEKAPAKVLPLPLTTEQLYASNFDWDSDFKNEPAELPEIPPKPPTLRRSPSTAKEYGMPTPSKRRRSTSDEAENAFAALSLAENDSEEERDAVEFGAPVEA